MFGGLGCVCVVVVGGSGGGGKQGDGGGGGVFGSTCFASLTSILAAILVFPSFQRG